MYGVQINNNQKRAALRSSVDKIYLKLCSLTPFSPVRRRLPLAAPKYIYTYINKQLTLPFFYHCRIQIHVYQEHPYSFLDWISISFLCTLVETTSLPFHT